VKRDYYEILGVAKNSTADQIKSAYRQLALKYHPDKNQGNKAAEEQFKEINEAYEMLSDGQKRAQYDRFGHAGVGTAPPPPGAGGGYATGGNVDFGDFSSVGDIFGDMFGDVFSGRGGRRGGGARKGADLRYDLELTLHQAFSGAEIPLEIPRMESCPVCSGSGAKPGTSPKTCPQCKGTGQVRYSQGFFSFAQTCPRCRGTGETIDTPCPRCHGQGAVKGTHRITVRIPAGINEGTSLRVAGAGDASEKGSAPGDLYVVVHLKKDPVFSREDDDLITELPLAFSHAVLGGEFAVSTIGGKVTLKIPAGTQPHTTFRVRNEGFPHIDRRGRGDLLVRTTIVIPKNLNDKQKAALHQFAQSVGEDVPGSDGIFKKVFG